MASTSTAAGPRQIPEPSHWVRSRPSRGRLAVDIVGAPDGVPVVFLHGTPGSRSGPLPRGIVLQRRGVRLISYDRPGYGGSDRHRGRSVADAAEDVRDIVNELGIDRFAVVGRSGGGPHALAVAAGLPSRVTAAATLVSLGPADNPDLEWSGGMISSAADDRTPADLDEDQLLERLTKTAIRTQQDPDSFLEEWVRPGLTDVDRRVVDDVVIRRQLTTAYTEALRGRRIDGSRVGGWADDILAFRHNWGFKLSDIVAPTLLWHGGRDTFSPLDHTRWLASRIVSSQVTVEPELGHFGAVEALPRVLSWIAERHSEAVSGG